MGVSTLFTASLVALSLFCDSTAAAPDGTVKVKHVKKCRSNPTTTTATSTALATSTSASPATSASPTSTSAASTGWWMETIQRQGAVPYANNVPNYTIFRNVKDYGAKGDGVTDDTVAINAAISDGNRCGQGCDSSTTTPAIVYFPAGTYVVSQPIIQYYYTDLIGDVLNPPTLKATSNFNGIAVIDSDPYGAYGVNWYTNQNNFFRQIRNFKIDLTSQPSSTGTGIHWQVAQATSLQNLEFLMSTDPSSNNRQQGIFMDNGSGGFMTDLVFNGGSKCAFFGNQQFTTRNMTFNNCQTAIYMNWNWVWSIHGVTINNAQIGLDLTAGGVQQGVGSAVLIDSKMSNTAVGVLTNYSPNQGYTNATLLLDNVDMTNNVPVAIKNGLTQQTILTGNTHISLWGQGRKYTNNDGKAVQGALTPVTKPAALIDGSGNVVTKSKPQYNDVPASQFVSVKSRGAKGDGVTDDTQAIQAVFNSVTSDQIVYFDHGAYVITDTVTLPKNVKVVGEMWALIMASGTNFQDQNNPKPVWKVGNAGDVGNVEIQDIIFEAMGPQPGAILMEFNVAGASQGSAGLFDVHFRVGGTAGTLLQSDRCSKTPNVTTTPNPECIGAFMLLHLTPSSGAYLENVWGWVADHELDLADHNQINIYNGRGFLIESTAGAWLWGTSVEHNTLVNYNFHKASNVWASVIQTETAYFQANPNATVPFTSNAAYGDPSFSGCKDDKCAFTWGLRLIDSSDILVYGSGMYSFYDNYEQTCVNANDCQDSIVDIENTSSFELFAVNTKASIAMITLNNQATVLDQDNRNTFCAGILSFQAS